RIFKMLPGFGYEIPEEQIEVAEDQLKKWRVIIQSMTPEEREDPKILNASRIRRAARGSGTSEKEVKTLLERYFMMRKMMKTIRRKKLPFFGKKSSINI
ncbi:MAG: signal recognition particle protein Srp19, partial [Candidatus Bathyarchaeia archaeon]